LVVVPIRRPFGVWILAAQGQFDLVHRPALRGGRFADWNGLAFREMIELAIIGVGFAVRGAALSAINRLAAANVERLPSAAGVSTKRCVGVRSPGKERSPYAPQKATRPHQKTKPQFRSF
jgi:hypothetical protein